MIHNIQCIPLTLESLDARIAILERAVPAALRDWEARLERALEKTRSEMRIDMERIVGQHMLEMQRQVSSLLSPVVSRLDRLRASQETLLKIIRVDVDASPVDEDEKDAQKGKKGKRST